MACEFLVVEFSGSCMSSWFVDLNNAVLEVDMNEVVVGRVGRPFNKPWLGAVHDGGGELAQRQSCRIILRMYLGVVCI